MSERVIETILLAAGKDYRDFAADCASRGVDAILAKEADASGEDEEAGIKALRALCRLAPMPVIWQGKAVSFEDLKKRFYAGASFVSLAEDMEDEAQYQEALARFGAARFLPADTLSEGSCGDLLQGAPSFETFKKDEAGLVPVIVQDADNDEVLMLAYMNAESYARTLAHGKMCFYSRSRKELWTKGETSGHYQYVRALSVDCDGDTILARVRQVGAACHTGHRSCFYTALAGLADETKSSAQVLAQLYRIVQERKAQPKEGSYTNYLFDKGIDKILKKVGEESAEVLLATKNHDATEMSYEIADLLYHLTVAMVAEGVRWDEIWEELSRR